MKRQAKHLRGLSEKAISKEVQRAETQFPNAARPAHQALPNPLHTHPSFSPPEEVQCREHAPLPTKAAAPAGPAGSRLGKRGSDRPGAGDLRRERLCFSVPPNLTPSFPLHLSSNRPPRQPAPGLLASEIPGFRAARPLPSAHEARAHTPFSLRFPPRGAQRAGEARPSTPQRQASNASKSNITAPNSGNPSSGAARAGGTHRSASCAFCIWLLQSLIHILQLGQIWRYFHTIYLGIRSRQSGENDRWRFYWKMVYEYADVSMLHLLATFLESAPQLVLQLCIIVQTHSLQALQGFTAAASLVSLAWALASYQKALRDSRDDKKPISYMAVIIQFCWHFFTIAARVITFALFASVFQLYFGIFIVLHWCIMTFWIVHCETEFCITKWEEIVFDMVVGIIYIFSWFNVKEGRTRCRLFIYYFVILLENTALSALWYLYKAPQIADAFAIPALCVVFSSFLTGVVFMLMYYAFFHPNGPRFGQSPSCACEDPVAAFTLPSEVATSTLRSISNNRSVSSDREQKFTERDGCAPIFQVRPTAPSTPSSRPPRIEESVIKIDLFRNRYPAWERHVLDRSLRKAILAFECSPSPPRLQYKDDALIQERLEYETTL
ncbi:XK-related protein 4 [Echinops telfairi]|uniref:XK-related protein n=1 Tax=Echinops telfairi TaxID=9371 RepID=A0ABM0IDV5_ECHTE|nr:XK-related protein 4 [Echinops telfairi]